MAICLVLFVLCFVVRTTAEAQDSHEKLHHPSSVAPSKEILDVYNQWMADAKSAFNVFLSLRAKRLRLWDGDYSLVWDSTASDSESDPTLNDDGSIASATEGSDARGSLGEA